MQAFLEHRIGKGVRVAGWVCLHCAQAEGPWECQSGSFSGRSPLSLDVGDSGPELALILLTHKVREHWLQAAGSRSDPKIDGCSRGKGHSGNQVQGLG